MINPPRIILITTLICLLMFTPLWTLNEINALDITVNLTGANEVVSIPNGCVDYSDNFLDHAEVTVKKSWTWGGKTVECYWRQFVDYFLDRGYAVTLDGSTGVFMQGPPLIEENIICKNMSVMSNCK